MENSKLSEEQEMDYGCIQLVLDSNKKVIEARKRLDEVVALLQDFKDNRLKNKGGKEDVETQRSIMVQCDPCKDDLIKALDLHIISLEKFKERFSKQEKSNELNSLLKEASDALKNLDITRIDLKKFKLEQEERTHRIQNTRKEIGAINASTLELLNNEIDALNKIKTAVDTYLKNNAGFFRRLVDFVFYGWRYQRVQGQYEKLLRSLHYRNEEKGTIEKDSTVADNLSNEEDLRDFRLNKIMEQSRIKIESNINTLEGDLEKEGLKVKI
jgi:hypothetical protein